MFGANIHRYRVVAARSRMLNMSLLQYMALSEPHIYIGIRYPKHVWSPAGGWYAQPANWKANTAIMATVILGITAYAFSISADREYRTKFPEEGRFFPSRWYIHSIYTLFSLS